MFATLLGPLPRPPLAEAATASQLVSAVVEAQVAAGLEPVTDGGMWRSAEPGTIVDRWRATASLTEHAVKAVIDGPWSATIAAATSSDPLDLERAMVVAADAGNAALRELAAAGCPLAEVHEPAAVAIGPEPAIQRRFVEVQRRLLDGVGGMHVSLAITGGSAEAAGIATLLGAPYASLALDLIGGPDNWRIAAVAPRSVGIVCGALTAEAAGDESVEILLYALGYAASTAGRGPDRVGVATAGSLAGVPWDVAERRMVLLGEAVRLALASPDERAAVVDPRAISIRTAALGRSGFRRAEHDRGRLR